MLTNLSPPEEKIRLFSSLFRGRRDAYARQYKSAKTGRTGYSPVCLNRWHPALCDMRGVRCAVCPNRRFAPISQDVIRLHLLGADGTGRPYVAAAYPMMADERAWFSVFLAKGPRASSVVAEILASAQTLGVPCGVERGPLECGFRVWFFFSEPVEARTARDMVTAVLFLAFHACPEMGVGIFDAILPTQDTLPRGSLGAAVPLPLQQAERKEGRTLFVDDRLVPFPDQWAFLSQIKRLSAYEAETVARKALSTGATLIPPDGAGDEPFVFLPRPKPDIGVRHRPKGNAEIAEVLVRLDNKVHIPRKHITHETAADLASLASFVNPEFYNAQRMRLPAGGLRRVITRAEVTEDEVSLPRGCLDDALGLLRAIGMNCRMEDARFDGAAIEAEFHGELRPEQRRAARDILAHDCGTLAAGTAFGKTVLAAYVIAARKTNTLVLVNRRQLQAQWVARLATFLDLPEKSFGRIGGGASRTTGFIDVALIQSLIRKGEIKGLVRNYGQVIVDECHALPAPTFEAVTDTIPARFFLGLSATVVRRDGHHPQIAMQCGPIRHRADGRRATDLEPFAHIVMVRPTEYKPSNETSGPDRRPCLAALFGEMAADEARNKQIVADVRAAVAEGRAPVVLSERRAHLEAFAAMLGDFAGHIVLLCGGMERREMAKARAMLDAIPEGEPRILLATGPYLGEGFDDERLDTLFLALPVSWRGRITQYVGRLHRRHAGKKEVRVYDYLDIHSPVFKKMFDRRSAGYEALGYRIVLPLSSTPGWPDGVLVPLEREWQETYAESVRRLCADGVDAALASLFVVATKTVAEGAEGADRARSAAEAFLFGRLESLPETRGRFTLNAKLPIAFGESAFMEPDLLCDGLRLVIEIDGAQHLGSADAYRRDRRKDLLLQENGFRAMRFLYEDVLARLDLVMETILRQVRRRQDDIDQTAARNEA